MSCASSSDPPASSRFDPHACRSMCGVRCRSPVARTDAAAIRSPTAPGPHRRADRAAEQVDQQEVAPARPGDASPLELVGVERLHCEGNPAARCRLETAQAGLSSPRRSRAGARGQPRSPAGVNRPPGARRSGAARTSRRGARRAPGRSRSSAAITRQRHQIARPPARQRRRAPPSTAPQSARR